MCQSIDRSHCTKYRKQVWFPVRWALSPINGVSGCLVEALATRLYQPFYSQFQLSFFAEFALFWFTMARQWSHGLFGCLDDCGTCLVTYFCHCYTAGKNAEAVGDSCLLCGLATFVPLANIFFMAQIRSKIREQKGIDGTFLNDILATCCCPLCMLVQSAQEVKGSPGAMSIARSWLAQKRCPRRYSQPAIIGTRFTFNSFKIKPQPRGFISMQYLESFM